MLSRDKYNQALYHYKNIVNLQGKIPACTRIKDIDSNTILIIYVMNSVRFSLAVEV